MASLTAVVDESAITDAPSFDGDISNTPTAESETSPAGSPRQTATDTDAGRLDITESERWGWRYTNAERSQRGLNNVSYALRVADVARDYSQNMATHNYIGHTEPNGEAGKERYQDVWDYSGSGYTFGENAANAYYDQRITAWGTGETVYLTTEREVAR